MQFGLLYVRAETRVRTPRLCKICGEQSSTEAEFSPSTSDLPSLSPHQCSILVYMLLLPEGQMGETWEPSKCNALPEITALGRKVLEFF